MAVLIVTLTILALISGAFLTYEKRKNALEKRILPYQVKLIKNLVRDVEKAAIHIGYRNKTGIETNSTLTLFEIGNLIDSKEKFGKEKYDDRKLFFSGHPVQILNFDKYTGSAFLPKDIKEELSAFYNSSFVELPASENSYIKLEVNPSGEKANGPLYEVDGEAYENWQSFKEGANNLHFVINQWLKEHHALRYADVNKHLSRIASR